MSKFPNPITFRFHHKAFDHKYQVPYVIEILDVEKSSSTSLVNYYIQRAQQFSNIYFYFATESSSNLIKVFLNRHLSLQQHYSFIKFPKSLEAELRLFPPPFSILVSENDVILNGGLGNSSDFYNELRMQNQVADMIIKDRNDRLPQLKNRQLLNALIFNRHVERSASAIGSKAAVDDCEWHTKRTERTSALDKASLPLLNALQRAGIDATDAIRQNFKTGQALMYNSRGRNSM